MKGIYRLSVNCGRQGDLHGIFVEHSEDVQALVESGIEVYFGEVLGKHSEIYGSIEATEIALVSTDENAIKVIEELGLENGYNPFDYPAVNNDGEYEDDTTVREAVRIFREKGE